MNSFIVNKIIINHISMEIIGTFYANSDDADGRTLTVQLTDNGIITDTTGYELVLAFRTEADTEGLVSFIEMDLTQGLYQVTYPTSMMVPGRVSAQIRIIDGESVSISRTFYIDVEKSVVDENVVVATNDFSALQTALTQVANNNARISSLESGVSGLSSTKLNVTGDSKNNVVTFTAASTEADIISGESHATLFGKILKSINTFRTALTTSSLANKIYPVGSIYMSVVATSPATLFGVGTWVAWGTGRVPVGINTSDTNFNTVEKTGGESTHLLTTTETPAHTHAFPGSASVIVSGSNNVLGSGSISTLYGTSAVSVTASTGGGTAHNNLQPYITCYMWKRTA